MPTLLATLDLKERVSNPFVGGFMRRLSAAHLLREAATTLGEMGPLAIGAVPKVKRLLEDDFISVRETAAMALKRINGS